MLNKVLGTVRVALAAAIAVAVAAAAVVGRVGRQDFEFGN